MVINRTPLGIENTLKKPAYSKIDNRFTDYNKMACQVNGYFKSIVCLKMKT